MAGIPRVPLVLGLLGLVPFWGLALALGLDSPTLPSSTVLSFALTGYGAVIVSFLGGIRWGLMTARADQTKAAVHYLVAVVPSLLAWISFALPRWPGLALLSVVALTLGWRDQSLVRDGAAPSWFGRLRITLSAGAGVALLLAALFVAEKA